MHLNRSWYKGCVSIINALDIVFYRHLYPYWDHQKPTTWRYSKTRYPSKWYLIHYGLICRHIEAGTKWRSFCRRHFQVHVLGREYSRFDSNSTEVGSQGSNWQYVIIGTDYGLSPFWRQSIAWTNDDPAYMRHSGTVLWPSGWCFVIYYQLPFPYAVCAINRVNHFWGTKSIYIYLMTLLYLLFGHLNEWAINKEILRPIRHMA